MTTAVPFTIRPAHPDDCPAIDALIRELAVYEKLEHLVKSSPQALRTHLFESSGFVEAIVAEIEDEAQERRIVGFALFFSTYSTFRGQAGLYLEDLYVQPPYRGVGIGKALLASVAARAVERGCGRLEWSVLNWNEPAIGFYRALGATPLDEWTMYRIDEEPLRRLADFAPVGRPSKRPN
jgi:GNAT superfamily N-acetyltransferase